MQLHLSLLLKLYLYVSYIQGSQQCNSCLKDLEHLVTNLLSNPMWVVDFSRYLTASSYFFHTGTTTFSSNFYIRHWIVFWQLLLPRILTSCAFCSFSRNRFFSFFSGRLHGYFFFFEIQLKNNNNNPKSFSHFFLCLLILLHLFWILFLEFLLIMK